LIVYIVLTCVFKLPQRTRDSSIVAETARFEDGTQI